MKESVIYRYKKIKGVNLLRIKIDALLINGQDNVATALRDINANDEILIGDNKKRIKLIVKEKIPFGHKFAIKDIKKDEYIYKYSGLLVEQRNQYQ